MHKSFFLHIFFLFFTGCLVLTGCSKSDDQREFERRAFNEPEGITRTDSNGNIENTDPQDWQISPMYRGLITIGTPDEQPPYPNPLSLNAELTIEIYIRTIETLNRIEVNSFELYDQSNSPIIAIRENISSPTLETISLSGQLISGSTGGSQSSGLYRILIWDGQQNLITYGDIRIGTE